MSYLEKVNRILNKGNRGNQFDRNITMQSEIRKFAVECGLELKQSKELLTKTDAEIARQAKRIAELEGVLRYGAQEEASIRNIGYHHSPEITTADVISEWTKKATQTPEGE